MYLNILSIIYRKLEEELDLSKLKYLRSLNLSGSRNIFNFDVAGNTLNVDKIVEELKENTSITSLEMRVPLILGLIVKGCKLHVERLSKALKVNTTLRKLDISDNQLELTAKKAIAEALTVNSTLTSLETIGINTKTGHF